MNGSNQKEAVSKVNETALYFFPARRLCHT